jgi:methylated-DNA-[protein]-cysteine S-methyltransferase
MSNAEGEMLNFYGGLAFSLRHSALTDDTRKFRSKVLSAVRRIPPGRVATYGDVAAAAGSPRASRAVGNIMRECRSAGVPCHRVIAAGGRLGGFGGNLQLKRELLRAEGILVVGNRVKEFTLRRWTHPARAKAEPASPKRGSLQHPRAKAGNVNP